MQFIIKILLLLTSSLAATGNANDAINVSTNPRDKRSFGLAILASLLQNSAPPATTAAPKMALTTPPPPQYIYNPGFNYQPHLPYVPDKNGYINFNVPDGYVLVTPPPAAPPTTQAPPPPAPVLPLKLQKKQSFLNFLATLSAGAQPAPPATTTMAPPPQGILIPKNLFPTYQQQLHQRVIYKYAQNHDTSSEADALENDVESTYSGGPASSSDATSYYHEGPGPVDSSYYKSTLNAYEEPHYDSTPDRFRISYPDDTDHYQPQSSEITHYQPQAQKSSSQEEGYHQSEHNYSPSYAY